MLSVGVYVFCSMCLFLCASCVRFVEFIYTLYLILQGSYPFAKWKTVLIRCE